MDDRTRNALRGLPSVDDLLKNPRVAAFAAQVRPDLLARVARIHQDVARRAIIAGDDDSASRLLGDVTAGLTALIEPPYAPVINGTGVIVQTNLGRAPISHAAAEAMLLAGTNYIGVEVDLDSGARGGRGRSVQSLLGALTGASASLVVNNNASAVLLALTAVAAGREVIVSRGEAVEIGGGFRIPDVLRQSGATLVEVGTTNRTYARDYEEAIGERTAAILRVHASNFAITGFTARAELAELVSLARRRSILLIEDTGSGCLLETKAFGLTHEPTLTEAIEAGVDLVCASGDKLLGGPQAGIILGSSAAIDVLRKHPLARALRADKSCLAGLAATLQHYVRGDAEECVPVWWAISRTPQWLEQRVRQWLTTLGLPECAVVRTDAVVGGGALPGMTLPSFALALNHESLNASQLAQRLRTGNPSVFPRIDGEKVLIDARTVLRAQDGDLVDALRATLRS